MVVDLLLVGAAVLAGPLAIGLLGSAGGRTHGLRHPARHPDQVDAADIRRLLARGLERSQVDLVLDRAQALGVTPLTMLRWIRRFDLRSLTVVVAAELSHEELLGHLGAGTLPDLDDLGVLAALNGLSLSCR